MNVLEAIAARHSVRDYADAPVAREAIERLLHAAAQAPTAMNTQHWAFGVIQGGEKLADIGERARLALLAELDGRGVTGGFRERLEKPDMALFHGATALIVIYGPAGDDFAAINCALAAENLMLAATELGLGTCWIGMASALLNDPEFKRELGVPEAMTAVAPIIVGHPAGGMPTGPRKNPPRVLFWQ